MPWPTQRMGVAHWVASHTSPIPIRQTLQKDSRCFGAVSRFCCSCELRKVRDDRWATRMMRVWGWREISVNLPRQDGLCFSWNLRHHPRGQSWLPFLPFSQVKLTWASLPYGKHLPWGVLSLKIKHMTQAPKVAFVALPTERQSWILGTKVA